MYRISGSLPAATGIRLTVLLAELVYLSESRYAARSSHRPYGQDEPGAKTQQPYDHLHVFPCLLLSHEILHQRA